MTDAEITEAGLPTTGADAPSKDNERAAGVLPGGYGRSTFASIGPNSPFAVRGEGYRLWDNAGRELIDLNNNFTTLVHGNAHPEVTVAAERAVREGASFGLPHLSEVRHAELTLARLPGAEQIRYTNSGSEAVMLALRVARAATGRSRVIFVRDAYHGSSDVALVTGGKRYHRGLSPSVVADVSLTPINDLEALHAAVDSGPQEIAAIVVDPLPNRSGLVAMDREFVSSAAAICKRHGIVLIADEVITFRLAEHGLVAEYGVEPDLFTLGKVIGGGFAVGAVAGGADLMAELNPLTETGLEHGGTFSGNPVAMAAGAAALENFDAAAIAELNAIGDRARAELERSIEPFGWEVRGRGSLLRPFRTAVTPAEQRALQRAVWWRAYEADVLMTQTCLAALSTPMDEAIVADAVERIAGAVKAVEESGR